LKWLLVTVAVLLVITISVGVTLVVTRDGSGGDPTYTSTPPISDIASANDTGPVSIVTADPTCDSWRALQDTLASSQSDGWRKRDPSAPASDWTPQQRAQYEAAGTGMRTAADQAVGLAKQTPHRVMRELYEQFIAYGRAYADSLATYTPDNDFLAGANISLSSAIAGVCDAITFGKVVSRASSVPSASSPSRHPDLGDPADPQKFLKEPGRQCSEWVADAATFREQLRAWELVDPKIAATDWTPEQRGVQNATANALDDYADDIEKLGRDSANAVFEDLATLAAQYFRAYSNATPTYTVADNEIITPGLRIANAITDACQASEA